MLRDNGSTCKITVDGTDCRIQEPIPFDEKWYSHKFKGAGLRYEVGLCIQTGHIVWKNGPYPCGAFPDINIARDVLVKLPRFRTEKFLADGGYQDPRFETPTGYNTAGQYMKKVAKSRHESVNQRIKNFDVFNKPFRNGLHKHWMCFHSIANMVQLDIEEGNELFQVIYNDRVYV